MTEKQIQKIKTQIKSFRAKLSAEKRKYGWYDDSRGLRFIIPDLYLQIADYKGALRYFNWFEKEIKATSGFPDFNLAWTIALFKNKKLELAEKKLYTTAFSNTYFVDLIIGNTPMKVNKPELISYEKLEFLHEIEKYWKRMLTPDFVEWVDEIAGRDEFRENIAKYIEFSVLLSETKDIEERRKVIERRNAFTYQLTK